jgi:hypothetical protein
MQDYWQKQTQDTPLYPDMLWSRPENRAFAGKLLIVGGNSHGFTAPARAFSESAKAGIGIARVLLPDALQKSLGKSLGHVFQAGEFAPSTPSGSFSSRALGELLPMAHWADAVLLAGELGRNSETAILLESFVSKHNGPLTITRDAADYFTVSPELVLKRPDTLLVISLAQLQKLGIQAHFTTAFTFNMDIIRFVHALHDFTLLHGIYIIVKHLENIFVAVQGQVSSTKLPSDLQIWRVQTAARATTWWLQNLTTPFAAMTTALAAD